MDAPGAWGAARLCGNRPTFDKGTRVSSTTCADRGSFAGVFASNASLSPRWMLWAPGARPVCAVTGPPLTKVPTFLPRPARIAAPSQGFSRQTGPFRLHGRSGRLGSGPVCAVTGPPLTKVPGFLPRPARIAAPSPGFSLQTGPFRLDGCFGRLGSGLVCAVTGPPLTKVPGFLPRAARLAAPSPGPSLQRGALPPRSGRRDTERRERGPAGFPLSPAAVSG
jgi:hypothetical protein